VTRAARGIPTPLATAATAVAAVAVYIALAIAGWGGVGPFFAHPALTALVVATAVLTPAVFFTQGNLSRGEREDRSNRWVIPALGVLGLLVAYVPAWTDRHGLCVVDGDTIRWVGLAVFVVGTVLRLWPVFVLGRRFSGLVAIQHGHALVKTGIYGRIRHPSYLGLLLGNLGWVLVFRSVAGIALTALFLVPVVARIRAEERLLSEHFGAEYDAYRARTSRLVPGLY
jgi:protein-S-isoprenylcysteine O-methyltransferase Ste14